MAATFDEMNGSDGALRPAYSRLSQWLKETPLDALEYHHKAAELLSRHIGASFSPCTNAETQQRRSRLDLIPRIVSAKEWATLEAGLQQRLRGLNMFLRDIYQGREILRAKIIPEDLIFRSPLFRPEMSGQAVPHDVYLHIAGIDIIRTNPDDFLVLKDNARVPSGLYRMLENREIMMRLFPDLFSQQHIAPVERYLAEMMSALRSVAPLSSEAEPTVVLLTPGMDGADYYEHSLLAAKLDIELVEGRDLIVKRDQLFMRTTEGLKRVDVIYRGIDDDLLDPLVFRPESDVGVPGLMSVCAAGNVTLANAAGSELLENKMIYSYIPEILKFYLGQEPVLKQVPTWRCRDAKDLGYVLDHLDELVVKEVDDGGGFGMLIGPTATKATIEAFREKLKREPDGFIAQPMLSLSTCPTCINSVLAPRHVDLRAFVVTGTNDITVAPGGLTRVALQEGSLVVNSNQGGGTKDTWIMDN